MTTNIEIYKITLIKKSSGADTVILHSNLPPATYPFKNLETLKLIVARGDGEQYIKENFLNTFCECVGNYEE